MLHFSSALRKRMILCPVSVREDQWSSAAQVAYSLAQQQGAGLILLNAFLPEVTVEEKDLLTRARRLKQLRLQLRERARVMSTAGDIASVILREAEECSLIVMRRSQPHWLVGRLVESLSQRVTRLAPCPVLLIDHISSRRQHRFGVASDACLLELPNSPRQRGRSESLSQDRAILSYRANQPVPSGMRFRSPS